MADQADRPLERYARILETLATAPEGLTLKQIADAATLQAGTTHRLVNSLCDVGFAARSKGQKIYVLGPRMMHLCHLALTPPSILVMAKPVLHDLVDTHGETAYLAKLSGTVVESVAMEVPNGGGKAYVQPGRIMPLHAAASAKAIFAFQDKSLIDRVLAEPRTKFTTDTVIEEGAIRAALDQVRADKFAACDNELDPGVLSYSAPVILQGGSIIYAIGISGLSERLRAYPREEVRESLLKASKQLSKMLDRAFGGADPASSIPD